MKLTWAPWLKVPSFGVFTIVIGGPAVGLHVSVLAVKAMPTISDPVSTFAVPPSVYVPLSVVPAGQLSVRVRSKLRFVSIAEAGITTLLETVMAGPDAGVRTM